MRKTIVLLLIAAALTGCKKECQWFMTGDDCEQEVREDFYGTYNGNFVANGQTYSGHATLSAHPSGPTQLLLDGNIVVRLGNTTTAFIDQQAFPGQVGATITGSLTRNGTSLYMEITILQNGNYTYTSFSGVR